MNRKKIEEQLRQMGNECGENNAAKACLKALELVIATRAEGQFLQAIGPFMMSFRDAVDEEIAARTPKAEC